MASAKYSNAGLIIEILNMVIFGFQLVYPYAPLQCND
eukprot:IDg6222t1